MVQAGELAYNDAVSSSKKKKFRLSGFAEEAGEKLYPSPCVRPKQRIGFFTEENDE
jgi:hypothetical protein